MEEHATGRVKAKRGVGGGKGRISHLEHRVLYGGRMSKAGGIEAVQLMHGAMSISGEGRSRWGLESRH